ncbi:ATP-binding protein [Herbiconiux daphne]|uniref:ATP-binding protein n=1 Tax=Herbiconiux daphne TaxID=2970914 RepID=A0ABT2H1F2_9MICO|nr:ATP-binding protein [Herbiconiux daphne]MCS5733773.1 ATP-binding protein [Herbiconiux daphne]
MTDRRLIPDRVHALLSAPANVAIHGSPGSGKSWMGDRVKNLLDEAKQPATRVDLSTTMSGRDVFVELLRGSGGDKTDLSDPSTTIRDIWRALRASLDGSDIHVVFVLDQFDRVLQFDDALDFLLLFRELVHRPESLRCTALILSRRSLQSIETTVSGISTLASVCYTQYLGSLGDNDLEDLGPGTKGLDPAETAECLRWSSGHPALAKYWLATRPDISPDPSGDMERAKIASRVLDHLAELGLIDAAAQYVLGPVIDDLLYERQELELLGILLPQDDDPVTSYSFSTQEHFRDSLRHRTWSMNPWGVLGQAEVRLRSVISSTLSDSYGEDWGSTVAKKSQAVQMALSEATAKQERDARRFSRQAPWLSYTYPGDLWQIMQVEWHLFATIFSTRDKSHWRTVMGGLAQYRAPLAHGRPEVLGEVERTQCRLYAEQILERITKHEKTLFDRPRLGTN